MVARAYLSSALLCANKLVKTRIILFLPKMRAAECAAILMRLKMNNLRAVVSVSMVCLLSANVAFAASASQMAVVQEPLAESGLYAGFGMGYAPVSGSSLITSSNGLSLTGRVGYALNRSVSVEAAYDGIAMVKSGLADVGVSVLSASVVGYYPLQDSLDFYGKAGYANASVGFSTGQGNSSSQSKTGFSYGFGVELGHGARQSFRLGMDHFDLSAWQAMPIAANNFSFSADFRF